MASPPKEWISFAVTQRPMVHNCVKHFQMELNAGDRAGRTLREAVQTWCDPLLIDKVNRSQQAFDTGAVILYEARREDGAGNETLVLDRASHLEHIAQMKLAIETDFRSRLERDEFHLRGIQTQPEPQQEAGLIPGIWAMDLTFDLDASTVQFQDRRYVAVRAFEGKPASSISAPSTPRTLLTLRVEDVDELSDEVVLCLLERHGRRVVDDKTHPLIQPSKVSFGAILSRRMEWRAERGLLASGLEGECVALVTWLATKIKHHQIPTARGMKEPLRALYRRLKAESKGRND